MIKEISLENFKAFGSMQKFPLRPITLIFGANSSGKSTILNSLLLLKQTETESPSDQTQILYNGSLTHQQSYSRCVFKRDEAKKLSIGIGVPIPYAKSLAEFLYEDSPKAISIPHIKYNSEEFSFSLSGGEDNYVDVKKVYLKNNEGDTKIERFIFSIDNEYQVELSRIDDKDHIRENIINSPHGNSWTQLMHNVAKGEADFGISKISSLLDKEIYKINTQNISDFFIESLYQNLVDKNGNEANNIYGYEKFKNDLTTFLDQCIFFSKNGILYDYRFSESEKNILNKEHEIVENIKKCKRPNHSVPILNCIEGIFRYVPDYILKNCCEYGATLNSMTFIGPLRKRPERHTDIAKNFHFSVGIDGEYTSAILYEKPEILKEVNSALSTLGLNYQLSIHQLGGDDLIAVGDIYSLQVKDRSGTPLTLCDVGFGLSQILPILVQSIIENKKTILIEQPEIHLHPKMQTELGDFFIKHSKNKQFIIETHSEHLILRIMRRIRETTRNKIMDEDLTLSPEDVCVLYIENEEEGSIGYELRLNQNGDFIDDWPQGFFAERLDEIL